ncbi:cytochrome P450 52A12 [Macroventuria anomochaeta]|uniref:Cytochrome P450 52A12 n=1 Tax=Macroventuria anomochaeta TaxID=301207 RepID=A0ACB6SAC5_9PLEO|nr:cytochrome P450 52A12 [Macroventuria anomochaeta]KAF2630174.1 cytochrome P450 52A12 [Macroventuria anomochaeta]
MHNTILLALWAGVSFVLYKIVVYFLTERHHRNAAKRLGCEPAYQFRLFDIQGIRNVLRIIAADKKSRVPEHVKERVDNACADEGKNITTFGQKILGTRTAFTVDPMNIQAVLATQFKDFGLGETRNESFAPLLGKGIFSTDGAEWQHARNLLRPQFAREQVSDLDLEEEHVKNLMRVLPINKDGWTDVIDIQPLFFRLTIDSATEFLFGESVDSQLANLSDYTSSRPPMPVNEKDFAISFDQSQAAVAMAARMGELWWLAFDKNFRRHRDICWQFIDHYVQKALAKEKISEKETSNGKQKYVFLDALAESTQDPIELRSHMISILLAGRDTTASLLSFVYTLLIKHPEVYRKLRAIVLENFGTYNNPRNITFASLKSCNYLQWVLNETLRLHPVVPLDGRCALKDTTIPRGGGPNGDKPVYVRKGTRVEYCVYVVQRRKDLWGQDADEFRPDRWDGRKSGWEYLPFNGGPRICIGQQFALTEAGYVLVRLAQRFEEVVGVSNSWESVENGGQGYFRTKLSLTGCPADGVKVRMKGARV